MAKESWKDFGLVHLGKVLAMWTIIFYGFLLLGMGLQLMNFASWLAIFAGISLIILTIAAAVLGIREIMKGFWREKQDTSTPHFDSDHRGTGTRL